MPSGSGRFASFSSAARFSAIVRPVTVMQSPCSRPASSSSFITTGTPPTRSRSLITNRPAGRTSTRCGTRRDILSKSSSSSSTPASRAIARRCSTAFVEPATAIVTAIAFSNASRVMMSRGRGPSSASSFAAATPDSRANTSRR